MIANTVEQLKTAPLLASLSQDALTELAEVTRERRYNTGEVIVREGETGDLLYVITQGVVNIIKGYSGPAEEILTSLSNRARARQRRKSVLACSLPRLFPWRGRTRSRSFTRVESMLGKALAN